MTDYIRRLEVGEMKANCYLILNKTKEKCLIIDPGDDADYIERVIADLDVVPVALIATHGHFDHIMAATELKLAYRIPFIMNPKDSFLLTRMASSAKHFQGVSTLPAPDIDIPLKAGKIEIEDWMIEVISVPGHTPGSVALYFSDLQSVFVGDLIFADNYVGRTDFAYSDKDTLKDSIESLKALPPMTQMYPGHGSEFLFDDLKS